MQVRKISGIAAVMAVLLLGARAEAVITYSITPTGTYTPEGMTTPVDVYTVSFSTDMGVIGALDLTIGSASGYGGNPFQVGVDDEGYLMTTPSLGQARTLPTATFARQADSHYLNLTPWPCVIDTTETNDGSLGTFTTSTGKVEVLGYGGMQWVTGVPNDLRAATVDIAQIGIVRGTQVFLTGQVADCYYDANGNYVTSQFDLTRVMAPVYSDVAWQGAGTGANLTVPADHPATQWGDAANWGNQKLPTAQDFVNLQLAGEGIVNAASGTIAGMIIDSTPQSRMAIGENTVLTVNGMLTLGRQASGRLVQSGGELHTGQLLLGDANVSSGSFELNGGSLVASGSVFAGAGGHGSIRQTAGYHRVMGDLCLSNVGAATGNYLMEGGTLSVGGTMHVGRFAGGKMLQTGGFISVDGLLRLGDRTLGTYELTGGGLDVNSACISAGDSWSGDGGSFIQKGGTHHVRGDLSVAPRQWAGLYDLQGGLLIVDGNENLGVSMGSGKIAQSGGTHIVRGNLLMGTPRQVQSAYTVSGGSLYVDGNINVAFGRITQGGGFVSSRSLDLGHWNTYQMNGGTLVVPAITGDAFLKLAGGLLQANSVGFGLTNTGGTLAPGATGIGTTAITGNYSQTAGALQIEVGSLSTFDTLTVSGTVALDGLLDIALLGGYVPTRLSEFPILTAQGITGGFDAVTEGFATRIDNGNTLMLVAVPEPATLSLLTVAGLAILRRRKK